MSNSLTDIHRSDVEILTHYRHQVLPFWERQVQLGEFSGRKDATIKYAYVLHPEARGSVAIANGRIESLVKYKEVVFDLFQAGYSVFIHDHRGQGLSSRLTVNPQQGYVECFSDYVEDFKRFYQQVIAPHCRDMPYLLCHSMGSAIGALYLLEYPRDFARVVFCAPMFGIRPALPPWLATLLLMSHRSLNRLRPDAPWYFWGQGDYQEHDFVTNVLTHSESRYQIFRDEYRRQPELNLGGVTGMWLSAAIKAMALISQRASEIDVPTLLLQAGADRVVDNNSQIRVVEALAQCKFISIPQARHELLMEADRFRLPVLEHIKGFFAQRTVLAECSGFDDGLATRK